MLVNYRSKFCNAASRADAACFHLGRATRFYLIPYSTNICVRKNVLRRKLTLIMLFSLSYLLTGCEAPPRVLSESPVSVSATRKIERALIVVPPGVLDGLKTFDRQHNEHLASALQTRLESESIKSQAIFPRVTDLEQGVSIDVMKALRPTHIVQISPVRHFSEGGPHRRVEWLVQVQQAERLDGAGPFKPVYKMTILSSLCVTGAMLGLDRQKACFDEIVTPILSALHNRGL